MRFAVDLHIHSALSPCAEEEMTPNNIINMALLKGLDIIAITDHNTVGNTEAVIECARGRDILVVPGMELETREEVHLVCLFPCAANALIMQEKVYSELPSLKNREDIFGEQLIFDKDDNIIGREERLLSTATGIGVEEAFDLVGGLGGVVIPAHIDRESYSIVSNLGFVPENLGISCLELSRMCDPDSYRGKAAFLHNYDIIRSSDAHRLGDILERESFLDLGELSIECLISRLKKKG